MKVLSKKFYFGAELAGSAGGFISNRNLQSLSRTLILKKKIKKVLLAGKIDRAIGQS